MSKLSFRARALDAAKPLPVYRSRDLPDLADCASINRAVPPLPTGMEKDEEREHHLQRAISASQEFREKKNLVIPVPEAESSPSYYDLYRGHAPLPHGLLHVQPQELDLPDYDMDSEDELLLIRLNRKMEIRPLQFETMVDRLEKATSQQLVSLSEAKLLLNEEDYLLESVYDYWVRKRRSDPGPPLTPHIRQEKRDGSRRDGSRRDGSRRDGSRRDGSRRDGSSSDAYVAFRRRTERMQTRKNRKNDEASYQKMLKLRGEFSRTVSILEMIKRREKSKREMLQLALEEVERRYQMEDFSGESLREVLLPLVEKAAYCSPGPLAKRHRSDMKNVLQKKLPFNLLRPQKRPDRARPPLRRRPPGAFTVNQADILQYDFHSSGDDGSVAAMSAPSSTDEEENNPDGVYVFRRKAGCQYLSPGRDDRPGLLQPVRHSLAELVLAPHWTGLSCRRIGRGGRILLDRASSGHDPLDQKPSLTDVLSHIQTLRRFCFRPRPGQGLRESSVGPNRAGCLSPGSASAGGITEQQYLSHQRQLIQMQKQQLEKRRSPVLCRHGTQFKDFGLGQRSVCSLSCDRRSSSSSSSWSHQQ
ncbi:enhancer of polycomb homolog 2 isoform X4 [Clinocottus analis]|uniref:enhancer of polycomb homolog 2 isoform X4 n=1 Tax=Clinocottus analis TaxID=304258 RepID=UPI0035C1BC1A